MKISQREARRLNKRLLELERTISGYENSWSSSWVKDWVNIGTLTLNEVSYAKVATARLLKHAVVVVPANNGTNVYLYADSLRREKP